MNLDELQSVQSRERQTDSLQQLRESFYEDAGEFIQQLREERDGAAQRANDPFDSPEVNRLSDDIKTAEQTVEAIYERRVGKIVKMASLAAADMPAEEDGLTREERDLFETLVTAIEDSRDHVLDVLAGDFSPGAVSGSGAGSQSTSGSPETPEGESNVERDSSSTATESSPGESADSPDSDPSGVEAADVMGQSDDSGDERTAVPPEEPPGVSPDGPSNRDADDSPASDGGSVPAPPSDDATAVDTTESPDAGDDLPSSETVDRTTVRITDDVGEIFGVDQREYDLSADDVVTLPVENAEPLVERDAAERLE